MKKFQKWESFPLGSIRPQGFLREQLLRGKDGMAGHLFELEPQMIYDPFVHKTYVPAWGDGDQSGWGAEISGNYWTGYIEHAFTLGDEQMIAIATAATISMGTILVAPGTILHHPFMISKVYPKKGIKTLLCNISKYIIAQNLLISMTIYSF